MRSQAEPRAYRTDRRKRTLTKITSRALSYGARVRRLSAGHEIGQSSSLPCEKGRCPAPSKNGQSLPRFTAQGNAVCSVLVVGGGGGGIAVAAVFFMLMSLHDPRRTKNGIYLLAHTLVRSVRTTGTD